MKPEAVFILGFQPRLQREAEEARVTSARILTVGCF